MTYQAETFIPIEDETEWLAFWIENADAIEDEIGDETYCRSLALNSQLVIGGGASPVFRVGFI